MTDNPTPPGCDTCSPTLVAHLDPAGKTLIRAVHQPACPNATPVASVAHDNA